MRAYRYRRWDGTQDPIRDDLSVEDLVDELSEDILDGLSPDAAMRRMMRRGVRGQFGGLRGMLERLRRARADAAARGRLDGFLDGIADELDQIIATERATLDQMPDDPDAMMKQSWLDSLPNNPAGRIGELRNYDWASPAARQGFESLLERLRQEMMSAYGQQMAQGLRDMTPEQRQRMKDMLGELNRMLDERRAGTGPTQERFDEFMQHYGDFFPENPRTLDELIEAMARRQAAMSQLLASLSPEQRAELEELSRQILQDLDLAFEVDRLGDAMRELFPQMGWDEPVDMDGDEPMGLRESLEAIERLNDFEELEEQLKGDHAGASLEDVDVDRLRRTLGDDAVRDLERLKQVERALEEAGVFTRRSGQLELTPRGIRKIGERTLARVFERLGVDRPGSHDAHRSGTMGEPTGATRPWRWGDPFRIDVQRTIGNAVLREGPSRTGRVRLSRDDFEIAEAETRTSAATVLLLDMSFSMPLRGHWNHAKRMALALHSLIASKYPEDHLSIVGFSALARELQPQDLMVSAWERTYGTNMQHAFNLAGRILAKHRRATKQILLVTDGEPTAHLEHDEVFFSWPPVRETLERTFSEAMRLARGGVTMNIFMLEDDPGLVGFIDKLARVVEGRVFAVRDDDLGDLVVRDYLRQRQTR